MRKAIGWVCYVIGGGIVIFSLQLAINCEIIGTFGKEENYSFDFWKFLYHVSGHHRAYQHGYLVHWLRDALLFLIGAFVISLGREQFVYKRGLPVEKDRSVQCPGCNRQTPPEAYCRYCGFNLVTSQPSFQVPASFPFWKMALIAYAGLSLFLLVLNLLLIKLGLQ
jgi:hypothetical protein